MAFTYGTDPTFINLVRLLIADTVDEGHIFEDSEIENAGFICSQVWQSTQFYNTPAGSMLAPYPLPYYRAAAILLDALAANKSRLASAIKVLDIQINPQQAAQELRKQAASYREVDDNSGAVLIIEQCNDTFSFRQRFWSTVQRQSAQ